MKRRLRIRDRRDHRRLRSAPRIHACDAWVALAAPSRDGHFRVAVTASRRLGGAVERNRARRRLLGVLAEARAAADSSPAATGIPFEMVLVARTGALSLDHESLRRLAGQLFARLAAQ